MRHSGKHMELGKYTEPSWYGDQASRLREWSEYEIKCWYGDNVVLDTMWDGISPVYIEIETEVENKVKNVLTPTLLINRL